MIKHLTEAETEDKGQTVKLELELQFDLAEPLAVKFLFTDRDGQEVPWLLDRASVVAGLDGPVGAGDVQLWPVDSDKDRMAVCLNSDEGSAVVTVRASEVRAFLEGAERLLPVGAEEGIIRDQIDAWLEWIMEA